MKHRSTAAIFGEWQRLAFSRDGAFNPPARESVEPRRLGRHLSDLFFLEADEAGQLVFRLAGTRICTLFGRELKATRLLSLWPERDRPALAELARNVGGLQVPALSRHEGISLSGKSLAFEMLLAPLAADGAATSLIGSIAVLDHVPWLGADPLVLGHLGAIEPLAPDLVLERRTRKTSAVTVNASHDGEWTAPPRQRPAPKLRVIDGGKA